MIGFKPFDGARDGPTMRKFGSYLADHPNQPRIAKEDVLGIIHQKDGTLSTYSLVSPTGFSPSRSTEPGTFYLRTRG